jgi:predicted AAA+ superfamily ATPase
MYPRLVKLLTQNSFFLFGARATGKSRLLRSTVPPENSIWVDFLDDQEFIAFSKNPRLLKERIDSFLHSQKQLPEWIVLDEIQRVPKLLNEVHRLLEAQEYSGRLKFALTGSSARKLKRRGANMLGGRALVNRLFPLTFLELGSDFSLERVLNWGSLPAVCTAENDQLRDGMLRSYVSTYISGEIREEQIVRQIDPFLRFLEVAAQSNSEPINNSEIARDCQTEPKTVARYFQILEDTLLGFFLPSFDLSVRKQQRKAAKFYFFDLGVLKALRGTLTIPITPSTYGYGKTFESLIVNEIYRLNSYRNADYKLSHLRTKGGAEIDLIVRKPSGETILIQIKSSRSVSPEQANALSAFLPSFKNASGMILSQDAEYRRLGDINVYPWQLGIKKLFELV